MLTVRNKYLKRGLQTDSGVLRTAEFCSETGESLIASPTPSEGKATINGKEYTLGTQDGLGLLSANSSREGADGERLEIVCGNSEELPGIEARIIYDMPANLPVLVKHIELANTSGDSFIVDGIEVETITPSGSGSRRLLLESDYVRDAMLIGGKRVYSPWIEDQRQYIANFLDPRSGPIRLAYPVEMDWRLGPGARFSSFRAYEFSMPSKDKELAGLEMRRTTRALFPWTRERYLGCKIAPARDSAQEYYAAIDRCADAGFEAVALHHGWIDGKLTHPLFTNYNDYELRPELFPNGWEGVRSLTSYAHDKGLLVSFYSIYVNTWIELGANRPRALDEHDWELIWAEDDDSARWGTTLDPATGWGETVNRELPAAIARGGFDAWHLDGPYYGDICVAAGRSYKPGGPNQVLAWERQKEFYAGMRAAGIQGEAAQAFPAFAHGSSRVTTSGYNEADFAALPIREQILANRKAAYDFTYLYRPEQATTSIPVAPWSEDPKAPSLLPLEDHADEYDAYLANMYGYGFEGKPFCKLPFEGPKSRRAIVRWLRFWKEHSDFFKQGYMLHLRRPDGEHIDAVMHFAACGGEKVLLVVYNPRAQEQSDELRLPFERIGWAGGEWTALAESGESFDMRGDRIGVEVRGHSATWYDLERRVSG